jgi:hypothetical protein
MAAAPDDTSASVLSVQHEARFLNFVRTVWHVCIHTFVYLYMHVTCR